MGIPSSYAPMARAIQEIEPATLIVDLARGFQRVLNVGPSWGRDYYELTQAGHQVFNLDVARQSHLPQIVIANIACTSPFPDQSSDAVLMAEVLEHIWNDFDASRFAQRVLKDNGKLIITVPFYNDSPKYHVRVHSGKTILRLKASDPLDYVERDGLVSFPRTIHATRKLFRLISKDEAFVQ